MSSQQPPPQETAEQQATNVNNPNNPSAQQSGGAAAAAAGAAQLSGGGEEEATGYAPLVDPRLPTRKDTSLKDFLSKIDDYAPIVSCGPCDRYLRLSSSLPSSLLCKSWAD
jgi:transcription initiation factor TFIID subunit 10